MSNTVGGKTREGSEERDRKIDTGEWGDGKETNKNRKSGRQRLKTKTDSTVTVMGAWTPTKDTHTHEHAYTHTYTQTPQRGFLTAKHVLLHCFLWVENYSGPDRFNDKLSKRQHVCLHARTYTHAHTKHSVGYHKLTCEHIYTQMYHAATGWQAHSHKNNVFRYSH